MSILSFSGTVQTEEELQVWLYSHSVEHMRINDAIYAQYGMLIANLPLRYADASNREAWLHIHQDIHSTAAQILGVDSHDLSMLDWRDTGMRECWLFNNLQEHLTFETILGV